MIPITNRDTMVTSPTIFLTRDPRANPAEAEVIQEAEAPVTPKGGQNQSHGSGQSNTPSKGQGKHKGQWH